MKKLARIVFAMAFLAAMAVSTAPQFDGGSDPPMCPPGRICK